MGSIAPDVPTFTPLELIGPRGYMRYVFTFPLGEDYVLEDVSRVLKAGYDAAAQRLPILPCEAIPDPTARQDSVMKLQMLGPNAEEAILVKDLRTQETIPSYAKLKARQFPVDAFDADSMCRRDIWPTDPGEHLPISLVQANFIRGGLILTWCILHMAGDGTSFQTWMQIWAEECRRAQGRKITDPVVLPPAIFTDREKVMRSSGRNPGRIEDHPEYVVLPFKPARRPAAKDASQEPSCPGLLFLSGGIGRVEEGSIAQECIGTDRRALDIDQRCPFSIALAHGNGRPVATRNTGGRQPGSRIILQHRPEWPLMD